MTTRDARAGSPSQGGGTGSNPVGAATKALVRALLREGSSLSRGELPITCPSFAHPPLRRVRLTGDRRKGGRVQGNIRQRGAAAWELRVFVGRDPVTGRRRYATKTVRGGKREAQRELVTLLH